MNEANGLVETMWGLTYARRLQSLPSVLVVDMACCGIRERFEASGLQTGMGGGSIESVPKVLRCAQAWASNGAVSHHLKLGSVGFAIRSRRLS